MKPPGIRLRSMSFRRPFSASNILWTAFVAGLLMYANSWMRPLLFRSWFFSSDEYVFAVEVIRFSSFNFHQFFFDNPGTPFMILNAALWCLIYWGGRAMGLVPASVAMSTFNYQHMPALFALMRATTLIFFLLSCVLLFLLCARVINGPAAAIATMLLAMSPMYSYYSSFVRTESMAMSLMLFALLWLYRGFRRADADGPPGLRDAATVAGLAAGIAAGARLHSFTAVLPVIAMVLWVNKPYAAHDYPEWIRRWTRPTLIILWLGSALIWILLRVTTATRWPEAVRLVSLVAYATIGGSLGCLLLYRAAGTRRALVRVLTPHHLKVLFGFAAGLAIGSPFTLLQRDHFFVSLQFYAGYLDPERAAWPFWKNAVWYVQHYLNVVAPDRIAAILLALGCVAILVRRERKMAPYLIGAALFFVSKPIGMVASIHHVALWLPFFFMVCGYPVGLLCGWMERRLPRGGLWSAAASIAIIVYSLAHLTIGPRSSYIVATKLEGRLHSVEDATLWIKSHTEQGAFVAISYYCFNSDVFYEWLKEQQVPPPHEALDGRTYHIWWGHNSDLRGGSGYVCTTHGDIPGIKKTLDLTNPGEGTDPFTDPHFSQVAAFGKGEDEVNVFHFDYR